MKKDIAPIRGKKGLSSWEGSDAKKPWDYKITAAIPVLDTYEALEICLKLLKLQTIKPYILVIDTGSQGKQLESIRKLQAVDTEVHFLQLNGVEHPSDFPAIAMDVAFALCRTEYLFATHADCFLRKRTYLEELLSYQKPVIGYEMSPRTHNAYRGMVSHTATLYHMPVMDKIGFGWNFRRLCNIYKCNHKPKIETPGFPDTEVLGNYILRDNYILPYLIGKEENSSRQVDENIDHFRSYTSAKLYLPEQFKVSKKYFRLAKKDALKRIKEWKCLVY